MRPKLTQGVHLAFEAHVPALMQELEELLYLWLGHLVEHFVGAEVLQLFYEVLSLYVELREVLLGVSEGTTF